MRAFEGWVGVGGGVLGEAKRRTKGCGQMQRRKAVP